MKHERRSIRMKGYDYSADGYYFVTVCTHLHRCCLGRVEGDAVVLTKEGRVVQDCWHDIPKHFQNVGVDTFVVMPNHTHGIVIIEGDVVGAQHAAPLQGPRSLMVRRPHVVPGGLGAIVRSFKSAAARQINRMRGCPGGTVWLRNYYERVIRGEREHNLIHQYIVDNPRLWREDRENLYAERPCIKQLWE